MSFTVAVKEEILSQHHLSRHELSAIIKMSGSIGLSSSGLTLSVITENAKLARHLYESFLHFYGIKSEIRHHQRSNLRKNRVYTVFTDLLARILYYFLVYLQNYSMYPNTDWLIGLT